MSKKLRLTVFLDAEADPELYRMLSKLPPRTRAVRLKHLALAGMVILQQEQASFPSLEREKEAIEKEAIDEAQDARRRAVRKLLASSTAQD